MPYKEEQRFLEVCRGNKLFLNKVCRVKGNSTSDVKRSLLELSFEKKEAIEEELTLEISRHNYTEKYKELTRDFYLKL